MKTLIRPVFVLFILMTVITGVVYPVVVTGLGRAAFAAQANGSLIEKNGKPVGSELIGQQFDAPYYFWGRLSATSPMPYNAQSSGGSNLGPTNPALADEIKGRLDALKAAGNDMSQPVPVDLVTSSGSGLDPQISPAAAAYQAARVAKARSLPFDQVANLIAANTSGRQFGIFGEARVNVLKLNLALDDLKPMH
ncbi:K+-transporting ATPase, C subunit [Burkholderia sp. Ch1-1]|uniref:Potassium-transporting ATPase KdpC subunit n=1 Tax=Paraburkholderia dioscoreae TaxID=2604047 RepID=A0A5Q4ZNY8_9BURK|nr:MULTISPECIES: potassium-transporting ATPase subunit KdpC [Paraburkholderia]EIF33575.1 K+-transporting ATPase, C subunit [Burkholderia sp. Ch1-1]MDR8395655.1 potassium-transporting ATPase subunit KdpC [Paraburkholderia sp. USG1]VVD32438.1 potassium translocating ATPase, subunit C [Paraburkholderia dioscoreae]